MKRAAIYARKSRATETGASIDNQIEKCKNYLATLDVTDITIFTDDGFSGKDFERPSFTKLLNLLKNKEFDILACYRIDRVSRSVSDFSTLINQLDKLNISFISVVENFDTSSVMGKAMLYITSIFSQMERETIAMRVQHNMWSLGEKGYWLGGKPPTGFKNERKTFIDSNGHKKSFGIITPIYEEVLLVKTLFRKYLELKSLSQLNKYLLQNNITAPSGKNYSRSSLSFILRNIAYVKCDDTVVQYLNSNGINTYGTPNGLSGMLVYKKRKGRNDGFYKKEDWIYAVSQHDGIINSEDWLAVQNLLDYNKTRAPRFNSSTKALLTNLIKCDFCNSSMRLVFGSPTGPEKVRKTYYKCCLKADSGNIRCTNKNIRTDLLDNLVLDKLKTILLDKETLIKELKKARYTLESSNDDYSKKSLEIRRDKIKVNIDNLLNHISEANDISLVQLYNQKILTLKDELTEVEEKLLTIKDEIIAQNEIIRNAENFLSGLGNISETIDSASIDDQRIFVSSIIDYITLNGTTGSVKIKFKALT